MPKKVLDLNSGNLHYAAKPHKIIPEWCRYPNEQIVRVTCSQDLLFWNACSYVWIVWLCFVIENLKNFIWIGYNCKDSRSLTLSAQLCLTSRLEVAKFRWAGSESLCDTCLLVFLLSFQLGINLWYIPPLFLVTPSWSATCSTIKYWKCQEFLLHEACRFRDICK